MLFPWFQHFSAALQRLLYALRRPASQECSAALNSESVVNGSLLKDFGGIQRNYSPIVQEGCMVDTQESPRGATGVFEEWGLRFGDACCHEATQRLMALDFDVHSCELQLVV
jgi:hypothetical protein